MTLKFKQFREVREFQHNGVLLEKIINRFPPGGFAWDSVSRPELDEVLTAIEKIIEDGEEVFEK